MRYLLVFAVFAVVPVVLGFEAQSILDIIPSTVETGFKFTPRLTGSFTTSEAIWVTVMSNADLFCTDSGADAAKSSVFFSCSETLSGILSCPDMIAQSQSLETTFCFCVGNNSCDSVSDFNLSIPTYLITNTRSFSVYGPEATNDHSIRAGSTGNSIVIRSPVGLYSTDRIGVFTKSCSASLTSADILLVLPIDAYSATSSIANLLSVFQPFNAPLTPTAADGNNFICLCRVDTNGCSSPSDYVVPVGNLVVTGALSADASVFHLGGSSTVVVRGSSLSLNDRVMLTDAGNCGSTGSASFTTDVLQPTVIASDGKTSEYRGLVLEGGVGMTLRVCWCGRVSVTCPTCCSIQTHFTVDLGDQVEVVGPAGNLVLYEEVGVAFSTTLTPGPPSTSHSVWRAGDRLTIVEGLICGGVDAMRASAGVSLSPQQAGVVSGTWTGAVLGRDGKYALCYCSSATLDYCQLADTKFVQVGLVMASGGLSLAVADLLIAGAPISIDVVTPGNRFTASTRIRVVETAEAYCGRSTSSVNSEFVEDSAEVLASSNGESVSAATAGTSARRFSPVRILASGAYRICVCLSGSCNQDSHFTVDAGNMSLSGATANQTWSCTTGTGCTVTLTVDNAASVYRYGAGSVQLVNGRVCGASMEALTTATFSSGSRQTQTSGLNVNAGEAYFSFGVTQSGYDYGLCWCPALSAGGVCTDNSQYSVLAGVLTVLGVTLPSTNHVCGLRANCVLDVEGRGLSASSDAVLLLPSSSTAACGAAGIAVTAGFHDGSFSNSDYERGGYFSAGGGSGVYYRAVSSPSANVVRFVLGTAQLIPTVDYRVCYCRSGRGVACTSGSGVFAEAAGRVAVRGALFPTTQPVFACEQNRNCTVTIPNLTPSSVQDRVRLFASESVCGSDAPVADFDPEGAPAVNDQLSSTFVIPFVPYSGSFQLCYCPVLSNSVTTCTAAAWKGSPSGTISVSGALLALTTLATSPSLPSVVSLAANIAAANPGFFRLVCAARTEPFTQPYPKRSDVRGCADCAGKIVTPYYVVFGAVNQVHIPLTDVASGVATVYAYCFVDQNCETETLCGVSLPVTVELVTNFSPGPLSLGVTATVPFRLEPGTIPSQDPQTVRMKVVNPDLGCTDTAPNLDGLGANGPVCDSSYSCRAGWPWTDVRASRGGWSATLCKCDRLTPMGLCQSGFWQSVGSLTVVGPRYTNTDALLARAYANPDTSDVQLVTVVGARIADSLMIVAEGACGSAGAVPSGFFESVTKKATTADEGGVAVKVGHVKQNAPVNTNFDVCWCPWETGCSASTAFDTVVGKVQVDVKVDCEVSEWFVDVVCSKTCGGGVETVKRVVRVAPQGGGAACPAVLTMTQPCNTAACPEAQLNSVTLLPATPVPGEPFQAVIEGWNLEPDLDRVLLIPKSRSCGGAATVENLGGAACWYGVSDNTKLTCGDGSFSMKVDHDADVRLCLCDASFIADTGVVTDRADACSQVSHYTRQALVFAVGSGSDSDGGVPVGLLLGILGGVVVLSLIGSAAWIRHKRRLARGREGAHTPDPYSEAIVLHVSGKDNMAMSPARSGSARPIAFPAEYTLEEAEEGSPEASEPDYWQPTTQHPQSAHNHLSVSPYLQPQFANMPLAQPIGYGPVDDGPLWAPESPSASSAEEDEMFPAHQPPTPRFLDESPVSSPKKPESEPERPSFLSRIFGQSSKNKSKVQPAQIEPEVSPPSEPVSPLTNNSDISMSSPNIRPPASVAPVLPPLHFDRPAAIPVSLNVIEEEEPPVEPSAPPSPAPAPVPTQAPAQLADPAPVAETAAAETPSSSNKKEFEPLNFDDWRSAAVAEEEDIPPTLLGVTTTSLAPPAPESASSAEPPRLAEPISVSFPPRVARPLDALAQELTGDAADQPKSGNSTPRVSLAASARRNRLLNMK